MDARIDDTPVEEGQFDDALEDVSAPAVQAAEPVPNPRAGHNYIDEQNLLEWSEESDDDEEELDQIDADEDDMEAAAFDSLRAEDEDWEAAEGGTLSLFF